jgi:alkanesulfonate monooxygenase SsuD/methylene tetrahydromethanopterin reductase-like flavin-dependent oxidoreductase (luciferase family)
MTMTFGVKTSQQDATYPDILRVWREVDETDAFTHAWLWDHLIPLRGPVTGAALEAWTLLAALAAQTTRVRLGVIVTSNRTRRPALLAKMAATVDIVSGGRLEFGIGVGASEMADPALSALVHREYDAYGIEVVPTRVAMDAFAEALPLIRRLWTEDKPFDAPGPHYPLTGAICEPKPVQRPHPPIVIGGSGERRLLRLVAEHADVWASPQWTVEEFRQKNAVLDAHCAAIGRDPASIARSMQVIMRAYDGAALAATRDHIRAARDAGANHFVLSAVPPAPSMRVLADEIARPLLAEAN